MTEFGAAASSSSSSISKWPYHVFLSFRGEDTRYGFTGNLYRALRERGIHTFIDDEGINKGEEITPTLLKTIKESKTAIVVFSKDYASSTFCLTELAQILDCMKEPNDRFIWPVFYDVDPSDIRHQKGSYKEAFDQYEGVKDETMVKRWRLALTEAAIMAGWRFDPRSKLYEYKIIEEIIQDVSKKIGIGLLHVARFPVGLECRVEEVCSLLNKEPHCDGATIVGIVGTGGIGKTTIARATYNEIAISFKDKCFLGNIKERSICEVQESLLSEILGEKDIKLKDYKNGISVITDRLCGKKVFLVLDDISTLEQLRALAVESNWFGSGSKIIVTTRDKSLVPNHGIYEVSELSDREARQLLILNAFKKEEEDPKYKEVINRAVKCGFGLPLALETFGSTFGHHKTVKEMESFLDIQEKFPNKTILQILKVSYDSLEELYKEVFLDIACFYRGYSLRSATEILSARHGIDSGYCINILIDKSLVKLSERGHFDESHEERGYLNMHDLIQEMGQEIVRQESPDVGQRSRLWSKEDILQVLNGNTGTATIQAMESWFYNKEEVERSGEGNCHNGMLIYWYYLHYAKVKWSGKAFKKMKNLRVLSFSGGLEFSEGPKCLPNCLRVMEWYNYPSSALPDDFCPINLVILRLKNSRLKTLGKACKKFYNLRELDLRWSEIIEVSDISGAVNLEELNVSGCPNLTKIDDSVGHLPKLRVLNAKSCKMLDTFIVGGIKLVSLEILDLSNCSNLHAFPEILVTMEKIKTLDLSHTAIKTLPESIEKLVELEALDLNSCKELRQLPNLACQNLKTLNLDKCKELEEISGILPNMEVFFARNCTSLTSRSIRLLLAQELHENGNTQFILPGKEIPKWFHKHSTEGSVSFWVRKKFPQIALCAILRNGSLISSSIKIHINGTHKLDVKDVILPPIEIEIGTDHIILFDLRKQGVDFKIGRDLLEEELNHVVVSWDGIGVGLSYQFVECIGVYVYNYDSCMEDILFENPSPQRETPEEVVHRICDSDLESLSVCYDDRGDFRDWIQEDDKLNKEIMDSSPKAASSIEKKKRKLNMDDENLTLSLALPEPSSDTTGHHDLQQQQQKHQHLTSINQQIPESSEIIKKAKGKDIIVYEGNTNERKGRNTLEVTYQDYRISSNSESLNWDPMTWEHKLTGQKDQSTIIDKVHDGRASHYSKDLQQQQHLTSIHQQTSKSSENVKKAKGKDIMVYGGNSNEKQCSNTLESQLQDLVYRQTQEEELHLANDEILTQVPSQKTEYFQDKDYGARSPSKRTSNQITLEHLQEQKKKIREEVVMEVHEEMRLREERMRVEFEKRLQSERASLLASFQQGQISIDFTANATSNAATSSAVNSMSNATSIYSKEPPN